MNNVLLPRPPSRPSSSLLIDPGGSHPHQFCKASHFTVMTVSEAPSLPPSIPSPLPTHVPFSWHLPLFTLCTQPFLLPFFSILFHPTCLLYPLFLSSPTNMASYLFSFFSNTSFAPCSSLHPPLHSSQHTSPTLLLPFLYPVRHSCPASPILP